MIYSEILKTVFDMLPILALIAIFQIVIIRRRIANLPKVLIGLLYVALGLTFFRIGLAESLIPIGRDMARQLVSSAFAEGAVTFWSYLPILAFATMIGFTATLIEPTLIAAAQRVQGLSGGALNARSLRLVVACGVAIGLMMGTLRILYDIPLAYLLATVVAVLILLALTAPRGIVPLSLDSGGIATSVVTVPLIAAFGVTVAEVLPNEATAADGFGLIVLALLLPAVLLLLSAQIQARLIDMRKKGGKHAV